MARTNELNAIVNVTVRLSPREREYIKRIGHGVFATGIRNLIAKSDPNFYRGSKKVVDDEGDNPIEMEN